MLAKLIVGPHMFDLMKLFYAANVDRVGDINLLCLEQVCNLDPVTMELVRSRVNALEVVVDWLKEKDSSAELLFDGNSV